MNIRNQIENLINETFLSPKKSCFKSTKNPKPVTYALTPMDTSILYNTNYNNNFNSEQSNSDSEIFKNIITKPNCFEHRKPNNKEVLEYVNEYSSSNKNDIMNSFATLCSTPRNFNNGLKLSLRDQLNSPKKQKKDLFSNLPKTLENVLSGDKELETLESKLNRLQRSISKASPKQNLSIAYYSKEINKTKSPIKFTLNKPKIDVNSLKLKFDRKEILLYSPTRKQNLIKPGLFGRLYEINRNKESSINYNKVSFLS
jgi:hypothetical protein